MIAANDRQLLDKIRDFRDYDEKEDGRLRYNYKMTDMQAALGVVQLAKLTAFIARRRAIARQYDEFLREYPISLPVSPPDREQIHYRYIIRTDRLQEILVAGGEAGIAYRRPVFKPLHHYLGMTGFPETDGAYRSAVSLPLYPTLRDMEVQTVLQHLQSVLRR